ncbi:myb-binding protein 1A-like protein [Lepisosteus oculatus]|uniref:myb-binding protein 1A-like protein n=1 Tax=Lepisosteus oculatus TaxID=7918 RepID=UPI0037220D63
MAAAVASMGEIETEPVRPKVTDAKGILQQNREFLDFFWDIVKPEQEIRLKAIEDLICYLKNSEKPDELKYTLKRLVDGLSHTRETARPGFSLALAQVLQVFEEIPLQTTLDHIKEKNNLETVKKKLRRNAAFGNFFGVLALSQSGRLPKEPKVVLECVKLLQSLDQFREHLKDLPRKTMVDILSETPEAVFEEVLLGALQSDLSSAFSTPERLHLLLVGIQKFPSVLKPKKLKKLLGTSTVVTMENIPKLIEVLKMAAKSVKKDQTLPPVGLDLLQIALREDSFELLWREAVVNGLLLDQSGPSSYMCYRLLGSALPMLSLPQLRHVLTGEVMRHYGEHVVSAQLPDRFKFAPEMDKCVEEFLKGCTDPEKQLAVVLSFTLLTNQGYPVIPTFWKAVQHLELSALQKYVEWLKDMFINPQLDSCLEFSTRRQQRVQESGERSDSCVTRLRKWIIPRLVSIVENPSVRKEEDMVMDIARFVFFHSFFDAKKPIPDIPETEAKFAVPLDETIHGVFANSFFGLLQHLNHLPVLGDSPEVAAQNERRVTGVTADGTLWIVCLVQYADTLLNHSKYVRHVKPFTDQQRQAWNRMLASVEALRKKSKKAQKVETSAFQQLFLLVGISLFKAPEECADLIQDLQSCLERAQEKTSKKQKSTGAAEGAEEPQWVEVLVEILLSLLSQPSRLIRQVCRQMFGTICPHVTQTALKAILNVLDPEASEEDSLVLVTDEKASGKKGKTDQKTEEEEEHEDQEDEEDSDSSDNDSEEEEEEEEQVVDDNFRLQLMKVLQGQNALATEEDGNEEEDVDDETMMKLDHSIAALFSEHKKRIQAKKDQKERLRKEKNLVRDFKIKVLDLVEVFLSKQPESPLVFGIIEPLLNVIQAGMSSESNQQEQDFLRKTADIFRNQLCNKKRYCKSASHMGEELHSMMERLLAKAQRQPDSSVSLYYFSGVLYLVRVLRGNDPSSTVPPGGKPEKQTAARESKTVDEPLDTGCLDVERVSACFREALDTFMTRRKSPLTGSMFVDVATRFPVLGVRLLDGALKYITGGVRHHQQGQACTLVLRTLQKPEVRKLLTDSEFPPLIRRATLQVTESLKTVTELKKKVDQEKVLKTLELTLFLVRTIQQQKLPVSLSQLEFVMQPLYQLEGFRRTGQLEDTYWNVMKLLGVPKPKVEKVKKPEEEKQPQAAPKKKKGFLPETKKRKNRKKAPGEEGRGQPPKDSSDAVEKEGKSRKRKQVDKKRKQAGGGGPRPSPPKNAKLEPAPKKQKKKTKKMGGNE